MLFVNWSDLVKTSRKLVVSLKVRHKMSPGGVIHLIGDIMCENVRVNGIQSVVLCVVLLVGGGVSGWA